MSHYDQFRQNEADPMDFVKSILTQEPSSTGPTASDELRQELANKAATTLIKVLDKQHPKDYPPALVEALYRIAKGA